MRHPAAWCIGGTATAFVLAIIVVANVGYIGALGWNRSALKTQCEVIDYASYGGNCWDPVYESYYSCYDVYLVLNYTTKSGAESSEVQVEDDEYDEQDALTKVAEQYPLGDLLPCWYSSGDETDVRLELKSEIGFIAALGVLVGAMVLSIALVLWCCCCKKRKQTHRTEEPVQSIHIESAAEISSRDSESTAVGEPEPSSSSSPQSTTSAISV
jgi:hypothetical protein